jgi:hydrogenase maturation protein HypF
LIARDRFEIKGQVQGVGFRPFIYKLANKLNLTGFIQNSSSGVELEIEGKIINLQKFKSLLSENIPPLARIDYLDITSLKTLNSLDFKIIKSNNYGKKVASISSDIAICNDCLTDIYSDKITNNYYNYFATNCTNCGPRYSIIKTIPYDRANTSMSKFTLCQKCQKNYSNPLNRRYHAQPIACNSCGAKLDLTTKNNKSDINNENIYNNISRFIKEGKIGAIKGVGGFHIVCDALNEDTISRLREHKNRPAKPFALMCKDINMIKSFAKVNLKEQNLLTSKEAPIVILQKNHNSNNSLSHLVAPNISHIGCMLPYTAFYHLLFKSLNHPIIATSANRGGEPIITNKSDILIKLDFVDFIVDYNRDIVNAIDDSVLRVVHNDIMTIRLSRGFAPKEIKLPFNINNKILSLGANQKSTIALAFDDKIIISPYIGDLDNIDSINFFNKTIETFSKFYDFKPDIIVCDKHPDYESTKQSTTFNKPIIKVQHHIAHLYSVKAEHRLEEGSFVGFIFDGTGLGDDNRLWGGEVFIEDKRKYYFEPIKLLGGEIAVKEPRRVALSMLFDCYSLSEIFDLDLPTIRAFNKNEIKLLYHSWSKSINAPYSSSIGRLFDGISSLSGICQIQSYEGEAGILSEEQKHKSTKSFKYSIKDGMIKIEFDFFDKYLVDKFYNTLVEIICDISQYENLPVILSGGVFQNKTLLELICNNLDKKNIKYYYNKSTPCNDGGISLGQIWYYLQTK